jgi:hypothetical protein
VGYAAKAEEQELTSAGLKSDFSAWFDWFDSFTTAPLLTLDPTTSLQAQKFKFSTLAGRNKRQEVAGRLLLVRRGEKRKSPAEGRRTIENPV